MNKNSQSKYEKALEYEIFTKEEYGFAKTKIQKAECIFDIWWHIGFFSKWCRNLNYQAQIHYFEPVGEFYNQAKLLLQDDENIILNNLWISEKTQLWTILLNNEKTMQSSKYTSFLNPKWTESVVNFVSLKDYLEQSNINKIDVLKMDIEWMEFEVISSWTEYERSKIENMIAEIHILNPEKQNEWNLLFPKIKEHFSNTQIIESWYRKEIFLLRCNK